MEWIMTWIRDLACLYLILSVVTHIVPNGEEKRYIQFFGGLLVTLFLLKPILQLGDVDKVLEKHVISNLLEESYEEMIRETNRREVVGNSYVVEVCEKELQNQMEEWMAVYGYEVKKCQVEFSEGEVMELQNLDITVKHTGEEEENKQKQEEFLKNELMKVYNIPEGNINISIQG